MSETDAVDEPASVQVDHAAERSRYEIAVDGQLVGFLDYRHADDAVVLTHTFIEVPWRGRGLGEQLVQAALDDLRLRDQRVVARCWFVADFIEAHPAYRAMRAA